MNLKEEIDQLIGQRIGFTVGDSTLFPFGFKPNPDEFISHAFITLKKHSNNFYCVMKGDECILMFGIENINKFSVTYEDNELFDIKFGTLRIVNLKNI